MKTGVIDVGGGMRGVYAAGVLDYCLDAGIQFDLGIGVSAGSANIASYIAGQKGRNYTFYTEYSGRRRYMSTWNLIFKGSFLDLNYIYGTLSNSDGENPFDYDRFIEAPAQMLVVATDAVTGEPSYFEKSDFRRDDYSVLKASSAIPYVCRPCPVDGKLYYDGALSDTVPIRKAFELGCDRVVLILTKPRNSFAFSPQDIKLAQKIEKKYPTAARRLRNRAEQYNEGVAEAKRQEAWGRVLILAPDDTCGVDTLTKDKRAMTRLYQKGYADAAAIKSYLGGTASD